jgi:hypothetical protein
MLETSVVSHTACLLYYSNKVGHERPLSSTRQFHN